MYSDLSNTDDCREQLVSGEKHKVKDGKLTASSTFAAHHEPQRARLNTKRVGSAM